MSGASLSYCQIMVGGAMTGAVGLQETMEALQQEGLTAETPGLGQRLVEEFRKHNYVPASAIPLYAEALLREYGRYVSARQGGSAGHLWRDPHKEHRPWYPTVFAEKCNACGECLRACPNNVLGWNVDQTKVLVLEPYECAPGCELCAKVCRPRAVILPPRSILYQRIENPVGPGRTDCDQCSNQECKGR